MILPTKRIPEERALIRIGADILVLLDEPRTITRLWNLVKEKRQKRSSKTEITFDWFVLALDVLYSVGSIRFHEGRIYREQK